MSVDIPGLKADLKASFDKPPSTTEESATDISQAVSDNVDAVDSPEDWIDVTSFENGWSNYNESTHAKAAYYKDGSGRVHLKGLVKDGSIGAVIFTLPEGYRPEITRIYATIANSALARANVKADGSVEAASPSITGWFSLDGISFRAV